MTRGQIYYIRRRDTIGSEIRKARPAIIVSNDAQNATSGVITVVYLTTAPKEESPTHATINATGVPSVALCEQIDTVDKSLVGDYCGTCTEEEMDNINKALCRALSISPSGYIRDQELMDQHLRLEDELAEIREALDAAIAQRDRYERLIDILSLQVQI